ncbi:amidohydrolase [Methylobacterium mesophilicum SR1.6/6]|uniref:Amidohydrolase n=1 Tax=Methylobacterium mesophilicum SR1.6/6 TaxID=908290 RepID=A0A6B9FV34_9HYPH|nr:amidohydrolase family protein [Methylobacterium mesophilicum]QGY05872.1 amidohydrolase [Methylobacterium mesophilicum SR1.6/6]
MSWSPASSIDCDIHPSVPNLAALRPYMEEHWRAVVETRGMDDLNSISYPAGSPLSARADWRPGTGKPAATLEQVRAQCLDAFGSGTAILNCLYGVQLLFSEDMAAGYARAVNDWIAREWLDREPRLRASIVVPVQSVEFAVDEIERCAADPRFVQVLLLAGGDHPLGKRLYWPIYAAAARHGLAVGIHAGSNYHNPPTAVGWPSYYTEDYVAQAQAFQTQLTSLICEGVFSKYPDLKVVLLESGWTWLPAHLWRLTKYWRGLRAEIPWVDRSPVEIVRTNVRLSLTPTDAPPSTDALLRILDHMGSDELLLFSTDYPHAQFEGQDPWPAGLPDTLRRKIGVDNPRATYARLLEPVA